MCALEWKVSSIFCCYHWRLCRLIDELLDAASAVLFVLSASSLAAFSKASFLTSSDIFFHFADLISVGFFNAVCLDLSSAVAFVINFLKALGPSERSN